MGLGILALVALFLTVGCSEEDVTNDDRTREFVEGTLSDPETPGTTESSTNFGTTFGSTSQAQPDALLRLEGGTKVAFSGICTAGTEDFIISGRAPKRYRFELTNGQDLSCRIQKRDAGNGSLRVVLLAGEDTRSVQQTTSRGSVIRLSYSGD